MSRQWMRVVLCAAAAGVAAAAVYYLGVRPVSKSFVDPVVPGSGAFPVLSAAEHKASVLARWQNLTMTPVWQDGTPPSLDGIAAAIQQRTEVAGKVPEGLVSDLAERLGEEILARGAPPNRYCDLASSDPGTRWTEETDARWRSVSGWFAQEHQRQITAPANRQLLEEFLIDFYGRHGGRLAGACLEDQGCRVRVFRIRLREQLWLEFENALPRAQHDYWMRSPSATPYTFRVPKTPLDEVLRRDGGALVAAAMVVVRTTGGENYNLSFAWFRDPSINAWVCHDVVRKGWSGYAYR